MCIFCDQLKYNLLSIACIFLIYFDLSLQKQFTSKLRKKKKKKKEESNEKNDSSASEKLIETHASVLGLCAYVSAFPYDVPEDLPEVLITLSEHINNSQPIAVSII